MAIQRKKLLGSNEYLKLVPVGSFMWWLGKVDKIPENWIVCDGQDITMYPELVRVLNANQAPNIANTYSVIRGDSRPLLIGGFEVTTGTNTINTVSAIPIIKAISSKDATVNLTDSEIESMLPSLTTQVETLETLAAEIQQRTEDHYIDQDAHSSVYAIYASTNTGDTLQARVATLVEDVEYLESIISTNEETE